MKEKSAPFFLPFAAFIGTVFGVGLYSLPYVMSQSGIWIFLLFLIIVAALVYFVNIMFADVIIQTPVKDRFLGYVREYVGPRAEKVFAWVTIIGFWGTFLVYLLVLGEFAHTVFGSVFSFSPVFYSLLFFIVTAFIIFRGGRAVEKTDVVMLFVATLLLVLLFVLGRGSLSYIISRPANTLGAILPYGALMFAMWGAGVIPELVNQLRSSPQHVKKLIRLGLIAPVVVAFCFSLFIVGMSGSGTSQEAFAGLSERIGSTAAIVGSCIGMITIGLAYTNLGWVSRKMLMLDMSMSRLRSMGIILLPPLLLLLVGLHNFVLVISIIGAIFLAFQGLMIFQLYYRAHFFSNRTKPHLFKHVIPKKLLVIGVILFSLGVILELSIVVYEQFIA